MQFVEVTEQNIADAGRIHSESWKESHRSFCSAEFVEKHTPIAQADYLRREMDAGKSVYMLIDDYPVTNIVTKLFFFFFFFGMEQV